MEKVKVTLVKSIIKRPENQKRTVKALGLGKLQSSRNHELTPQVQGMIRKVSHLISIEKV